MVQGKVMSGTNGDLTNSGNGVSAVLKPRAESLAKRRAANQDGNFSQMHYARQGVVTEEMEYVARREKISAELVRSMARWGASAATCLDGDAAAARCTLDSCIDGGDARLIDDDSSPSVPGDAKQETEETACSKRSSRPRESAGHIASV